jgi:hypothetical protein
MISTKNIIVLLETQQQLTQVGLPNIRGSSGISIIEYLPVALMFHKLRNITLQLSNSNGSNDVSSAILQKSPNLDSIHLRLPTQNDRPTSCVFTVPKYAPRSWVALFSMATRLTIIDYDFRHVSVSVSMPTFPVLRALAVVDCQSVFHFQYQVSPKQYPRLRALIITAKKHICGELLAHFIAGLSCLRELVVYGRDLYFDDASSLRLHARTLDRNHRQTSPPVTDYKPLTYVVPSSSIRRTATIRQRR